MEEKSVDTTKRAGRIMLHVHDGQCRYPVETEGRTHYFCGKPTSKKEQYCPRHRQVVYIKEPR